MSTPHSGYAAEIYLQGLAGTLPAFTTDPAALEDAARERMEPGPFGYVAGAATSGATARANREAFDRYRLVPRMLTDASARSLTTTVLGTELAAPVITAPIGVQSIVHPEAERAVARVAAELGLGMAVSTVSSVTLEEVAVASGEGARWFQLYWPNDEAVCASLLARAKAAGYGVLMVTLDTWMLGWRPRDLDGAYLPFLSGEGLANYFSDEAFCAALAKPPAEDLMSALLRWMPMFTGTDHSWDQIAFLREHWDGPIVLKGICHPTDARRAIEAGVQGVVVSNHGGRQVDGAIAALDALPAIAEAVGDRIEVLFDSGIRTGSDVMKALALGARAVLVGRPWVYGLALGGADGVRHVLRGLLADLDLTLGLAGYRSPGELSADSLAVRP